jgi:hypothetical protein
MPGGWCTKQPCLGQESVIYQCIGKMKKGRIAKLFDSKLRPVKYDCYSIRGNAL